MTTAWASATKPARGMMRSIFLRLNSSPSANISRMTPSSDHVRTVASSATSGIGMCGPAIMPASK